jgi:mono/diheme cytochrome c family protein
MKLIFLLCLAGTAHATDPTINFLSGTSVTLSLTPAELNARKDSRVIEVLDPFYGRLKRYRATPIKNLLTAAYGPAWIENGIGEFFFETLDGYKLHVKVPILSHDGGMLVFDDTESPLWEEMPKTKVNPGPFYLVWLSTDQSPRQGYPWPWQILSINSSLAEDQFPKAVPRNVPMKSRAPVGWTIFRTHCISCHAMNGQGGNVGPDLNEPRGITRYHDKKHLKAYIRKASSFRHTKMPDFDELQPQELDDLMTYFDFMSVQSGTH